MIKVVVVDDDFRVARVHAAFVDNIPGLRTAGVAHNAAQALELAAEFRPDLMLVDNYLPDRSGLALLPELTCDVIMITADTAGASVRAALSAGALGYLIKPFSPEALADRLKAYQKYRSLLSTRGDVNQEGIDRAVLALHAADRMTGVKGQSPVTARLVSDALGAAVEPQSAADLAERLGIARATAQRYLAALVDSGEATMNLRYGSTGRPEHEYLPVR